MGGWLCRGLVLSDYTEFERTAMCLWKCMCVVWLCMHGVLCVRVRACVCMCACLCAFVCVCLFVFVTSKYILYMQVLCVIMQP